MKLNIYLLSLLTFTRHDYNPNYSIIPYILCCPEYITDSRNICTHKCSIYFMRSKKITLFMFIVSHKEKCAETTAIL